MGNGKPALPQVTVVIPTFNRAAFLPSAVRSALEQTLHEIEVVIVDDGSTDVTPEVCRSLAAQDHRVRVIRQTNRGLAAARNAGIAAARAGWVAFLDDDDLWVEAALETLLGHTEPTAAAVVSHAVGFTWPTADVSARAVLADPERFRVAPWPAEPPCGRIELGDLLLRPLFPPNAVLVGVRALQETGGFNEARCAAEDYEVWLNLAARGPLPVIGAVLALYRWHTGQMSAALGRQARETRLVLEAFLATHQQGWTAAGRNRLRRRLAFLAREEAYAALLARERHAAGAAAWRSVRWSPTGLKSWFYLALSRFPRVHSGLRRLRHHPRS